MLKRTLALALVALMLVSTLVACAGDGGSTETTAAPAASTTAASAESNTPETTAFDPFAGFDENLRYDGHTFTIHNANRGSSWYTRISVVSEEQTGDIINDAMFTRQSKVEERFGVKIVEVESNDLSGDIRREIQANTGDYNMAFANNMACMSLAAEGNFYDLNDIEQLNLDQPWWDQRAREDMSINNKLFYITGAFDITRLDGIRTVYYNKSLANEYNLGDLYAMVDNGTWTLDKYTEMCMAVKADLDGNTVASDGDRYGVVSYNELLADTLIAGCGFKYIDKDQDDLLISNLESEAFYSAYEKIRHIMHDDNMNYCVRKNTGTGKGDRAAEYLFMGNQSLFYSECMAWTRELRKMESDFGVLPPPKLDEAQDRYYAIVLNPWNMVVLSNNNDLEFTGNIMEALNAASYDTIIPAYIDITLMGRVARDPETVRMLELVFDNLYYIVHHSDVITRSTVQSALTGNNANIASTLKTTSKVNAKLLERTNAKFTVEG